VEGSASTWRTACTRTTSCATTRRWTRQTSEGAVGLRLSTHTTPEKHGVTATGRRSRRLIPRAAAVGERPGSPDEQQMAALLPADKRRAANSGFQLPVRTSPAWTGPRWPDRRADVSPRCRGACPVWMGSNHDLGRVPSRWCGGDERKIRLAAGTGHPARHQCSTRRQIGMTDVDVPAEKRRDTRRWREGGADGTGPVTPMPWDGSPGRARLAPGRGR